jgi:hypothetical protein
MLNVFGNESLGKISAKSLTMASENKTNVTLLLNVPK